MAAKDLFALETFAVGVIGVVASEIAAQVSLGGSRGADLPLIALLATSVAAIAFALQPLHRAAPLVLATIWFARAGSRLGDALYEPSDFTLWVAAAEAAAIAAVMLRLASRDSNKSETVEVLARTAASAMLLLFAYVHLFHGRAIIALIPASLPARSVLPLLSGSIMAAASVLLWIRSLARSASLAVATMFMAWVPLIHAPRLIADPTNPSEWRFAFMALCLAGCLIVIGRENQARLTMGCRGFAVQPN